MLSIFWRCLFFCLGVLVALSGCDCGETRGREPTILKTNLAADRLVIPASQETASFQLFAEGIRAADIQNIQIIEDEHNVFTLLKSPQTPLSLQPGKERGVQITIQFAPKHNNTIYKARIAISSNNSSNVDSEGRFYVELAYSPGFPDPVLCRERLDFGALERGASKTLTCQVKNRGDAAWKVSSIRYESEKGDEVFRIEDVSAPFAIEPGETREFKVSYSPKTYPPKESQGVFVFESNLETSDDSQKLRLRVVGTIKVPLVELIPVYPPCSGNESCQNIDVRLSCVKDASGQGYCRHRADALPVLKFPLTSKGKTTIRTFLLRSTGDLPLVVESVAFRSASSQDFSLRRTGLGLPLTLEPGQEKELSVVYAPSDEVEDKGTLEVKSNAANVPVAPVLVEADSRGCNLEVFPQKITFAGAGKRKITLLNAGNEDCLFQKAFLRSRQSAPFSLIPAPAENQVIRPNESLSFLVGFVPSDKHEQVDVLVIESNDPKESSISVALRGKSLSEDACSLRLSTKILLFPQTAVGKSAQQSLEIVNDGWGECGLISLDVKGTRPAHANAFTFVAPVSFPTTLKTGSVLSVQVTYTPPQDSGFEGVLTLKDRNDVDYTVQLVGTSGSACLEILPAHLDFGSTKVGCSSPTRDVDVYHSGVYGCMAPITISKINFSSTTSPEFRIVKQPVVPLALNRSKSFRIELSYKAKDLGKDTGVVKIHTNIPNQSPFQIPLAGQGIGLDEQTDVFTQFEKPVVDILFVVDDSGSMLLYHRNLVKNFVAFSNWAAQLKVDFHLGVVTTDVKTCPGHPCTVGRPPGCLRGSIKFFVPSTPDFVKLFANNANVGVSGSDTERGLEAIYRALTPPRTMDPKCNLGFYRKDATLSLVIVSDEIDQSPKPVDFYIRFLSSLKGARNPERVRFSAIALGEVKNGVCSVACRYHQVTKAFGGVYQHIMQFDWLATLTTIAESSFTYRSQFYLSRVPDPKTIIVKVDGVVQKPDPIVGWVYESASNRVVFSKQAIPARNATIQISYKSICLP